jgi:hypothetical protein
VVPDDPSVTKLETGIDSIVHFPPGGSEGVPGFPVRPSRPVVSHNINKLDSQILSPLTEHPPHRRGSIASEIGENFIGELNFRVITGRHPGGIAVAKGGVEPGDQLGVGVHEEGVRHWGEGAAKLAPKPA